MVCIGTAAAGEEHHSVVWGLWLTSRNWQHLGQYTASNTAKTTGSLWLWCEPALQLSRIDRPFGPPGLCTPRGLWNRGRYANRSDRSTAGKTSSSARRLWDLIWRTNSFHSPQAQEGNCKTGKHDLLLWSKMDSLTYSKFRL